MRETEKRLVAIKFYSFHPVVVAVCMCMCQTQREREGERK